MDREADPPTQLMIDEAILDYLIYTAIRRILESPGNTTAFSDDRTDLPLEMVGCKDMGSMLSLELSTKISTAFLPMFKCLHPDHDAPVEIRFRLRLLRFTYVVTRRRHRTSSPLTTNPRLNSQTQDNRFQSTESSSQEQLDAVSLHKTLPSFLALSAAQNALQESTITELWMRLAAGYMAQAYAEDVLIHTRNRSGLLEEAFKWGYDADCSAEEGSDQWLINEMFDADQDVLNLWEDIKEEHMSAVSSNLRYLSVGGD